VPHRAQLVVPGELQKREKVRAVEPASEYVLPNVNIRPSLHGRKPYVGSSQLQQS